ncbi:methylthioadenosine phosphorylase [Lichtheimia corymbifera JMRC:FSU:9682]|uniref:S-methyl-5'-thioadenosine phosphorylase n=2 Tax=Lichtheimia TaxID=688353 RepID=A0A068RSU4_9FUNG|nr:methylthioadenosine phosphorylase [Lichtheimia ornata]KAJ8663452.1 methylthioadenosine phosphorylase [Lichtheimia ornata]CDH52795.1 methylthioadenosine phosphorylase [Lichtheimia corymbifera JMRC:FSU:9682]
MHDVKIAVIGGSGLYHLDNLEIVEEVHPETPWGFPSDKITIAKLPSGTKIAFLARHGRGHYLTPTEVPVRANIAALKHLGVEAILAFSAVGSLREEIPPCDFVLPDQLIDRTRGLRPSTFFGNGVVAHALFAEPFHKGIADLVYEQRHVLEFNSTLHRNKTAVCMEGPQFSTKAESHMYRSWGADIINMSALPEAKLAREAEIAYQMVCMSTDYDCWREEEEGSVTVETVMQNMVNNSTNAKTLLMAVLPHLDDAVRNNTLKPDLKGSMKFAGMTAQEKRNPETVKKLDYILPGYY